MEVAAVAKHHAEPLRRRQRAVVITDDLLGLPRGQAREHARHPDHDEGAAEQERPDAEVDQADVEQLERLDVAVAGQVGDRGHRQQVVEDLGRSVVPVVGHDLDQAVDAYERADAGVEGEHDEETLVAAADAPTQEVAVVVRNGDAGVAQGAVVCSHRNMQITDVALLPGPLCLLVLLVVLPRVLGIGQRRESVDIAGEATFALSNQTLMPQKLDPIAQELGVDEHRHDGVLEDLVVVLDRVIGEERREPDVEQGRDPHEQGVEDATASPSSNLWRLWKSSHHLVSRC